MGWLGQFVHSLAHNRPLVRSVKPLFLMDVLLSRFCLLPCYFTKHAPLTNIKCMSNSQPYNRVKIQGEVLLLFAFLHAKRKEGVGQLWGQGRDTDKARIRDGDREWDGDNNRDKDSNRIRDRDRGPTRASDWGLPFSKCFTGVTPLTFRSCYFFCVYKTCYVCHTFVVSRHNCLSVSYAV